MTYTDCCCVQVNRRKKTQDRILVVSNQWIYNMEMFGEEGPQEEFKWSLPIGNPNNGFTTTWLLQEENAMKCRAESSRTVLFIVLLLIAVTVVITLLHSVRS